MLRLETNRLQRGFTLLELVLVIAVMSILLAIAVPMYEAQVLRAKEAVLRQNLFLMRRQLDNYTVDKEEAPSSLQDLVTAGYLREVPIDPITGSADTWQVVMEDESISLDKTVGIKDVFSGAEGIGSDGRAYSEW